MDYYETKESRLTLSSGYFFYEMLLMCIIASAGFLGVSIFSYDPNDPGWTQTTIHQPINNAAGKIGAYTADTFFFLFGAVSYFIPFVLVIFSVMCWRKVYTDTFINFFSLSFRVIGLFLILMSSSVLAGLNIDDTHSFSSGGIVGNIFIALLFPLLNSVGTTLLMLFIWLVSFSLFTRLSPLSIAEKLGEIILITFTLGASRDKNIIDDMNAKDEQNPYAFMDSEQTNSNNSAKKSYQSPYEVDEPYDLVQNSDVRKLTANTLNQNHPTINSENNEHEDITPLDKHSEMSHIEISSIHQNTSERIEPTITFLDDESTPTPTENFSETLESKNPGQSDDQSSNKMTNSNTLTTQNASTTNNRPIVTIVAQNNSQVNTQSIDDYENTDILNFGEDDSRTSLTPITNSVTQSSIQKISNAKVTRFTSTCEPAEKLEIPENNTYHTDNAIKVANSVNNSSTSQPMTTQNSLGINTTNIIDDLDIPIIHTEQNTFTPSAASINHNSNHNNNQNNNIATASSVNTTANTAVFTASNKDNTNIASNTKAHKTDHAVRNKLAAFGIRIPSSNELRTRYAEKFNTPTTSTSDENNLSDTINREYVLTQNNSAHHDIVNHDGKTIDVKNNTDITEQNVVDQLNTSNSTQSAMHINEGVNAQAGTENKTTKYKYEDNHLDETTAVLPESDFVINSASDTSSLMQIDEDTLIIHSVQHVPASDNHLYRTEHTNNSVNLNPTNIITNIRLERDANNNVSHNLVHGNHTDPSMDKPQTVALKSTEYSDYQTSDNQQISNTLEQVDDDEMDSVVTTSFEPNNYHTRDIQPEIKDINTASQPDLFHPFLVRGQDEEMEKPTEPLPTLDLLYEVPAQKIEIDEEELRNTAQLIENALADFRIKVSVVEICTGPVITRFELELAPGVKVSRISSLDRDLARALSVSAVRVVEVIPGKPYVGLELPNPIRQTLVIRDVLNCHEFVSMKSPLAMVLGKDIAGDPVIANLAKMPHLLVAGTTGSGKSVGVNAMIISILYKASPEDVRFIMIDPKMLELSVYEGIPHLLTNVVTDMKDASNALRWCVAEMDRRYKLMAALGVRNLDGYNEKIAQAEEMQRPVPDPFWKPSDSMSSSIPHLIKLPFIVVVVDEFADLMMTEGKKVEELIARLAQKARAAGIHLVLATQRPSVDVITGLIKANIPTRIAFTVSSKIDSRTILDQGGAESLLGAGDMLYLPPNSSTPIRVHGAFVRDEEVHKVVANWKARGKPQYMDAITAGEKSAEGENGENGAEALDPMFDHAVQFVIEKQRVSISGIQRQFRLGYNRAARIVEEMEAQGIVSAPAHNGNREVLAQ